MAFKNRVRLPFYLRQAQFPTDTRGFRLFDGTMKNTSVVVRKVYQAVTDQLPEHMHEKLVIALSHDNVTIEGARYAGQVAKDGDYQINWQDFIDYPIADANFQVQVTPYDVTNNNCGSCEDLQQISCIDDTYPGALNPGDAVSILVISNDSICCFPYEMSVVWFNDAYVNTVGVGDPGYVNFMVNDPAPDGDNVKLFTYRITCADGSYDEADVYGTIDGNTEICLPPTALHHTHIDESEISTKSDEISFTPASGVLSYQWQLFLCSNLGTPINSGTTDESPLILLGLDDDTCYVISIRSVCDEAEGIYSEWTSLQFYTPATVEPSLCARFRVQAFDSGNPAGTPFFFTYMDCSGNLQNVMVANFAGRYDCMLVTSMGVPVYFSAPPQVSYSYEEPC